MSTNNKQNLCRRYNIFIGQNQYTLCAVIKDFFSQMWSFWSGIFLFMVIMSIGLVIIAYQFVCHLFGKEMDDIAF